MDVQKTILTNKSLSSSFTQKPQGKTGPATTHDKNISPFNTVETSINTIKKQIEAEERPEVRDELEISYSRKKIELENLKSQQSVTNVDDAQEILGTYSGLLGSTDTLDAVFQLDPHRVSDLIQ